MNNTNESESIGSWEYKTALISETIPAAIDDSLNDIKENGWTLVRLMFGLDDTWPVAWLKRLTNGAHPPEATP